MSSTRYAFAYIEDGEGTPSVPWQAVMDAMDTALSGIVSIALAGSNVTLTDSQSRYRVLNLTGTLTGNINGKVKNAAIRNLFSNGDKLYFFSCEILIFSTAL